MIESWGELNPKMYFQYKGPADMIIAFSLKCGSYSVKSYFGKPRTFLKRSQVASDPRPVVLYMRDPIERFVSGWRYFSWDRQEQHIDRGGHPKMCSLERWFKYCTEEFPNNLHWVPQTVIHTHEGRFLPTEVRPLSSLPTHTNKSSALGKYDKYLDEEPHMRAILEDWYAGDLEVWHDLGS